MYGLLISLFHYSIFLCIVLVRFVLLFFLFIFIFILERWNICNQENERSFICLLGEPILPLSTNLKFDFGIVPTMW